MNVTLTMPLTHPLPRVGLWRCRRNTAVPQEIQTPNIDAIFGDDGVTLTRHYTYKFCAPTRSALQSGRLPVHVNTVNAEPECRNPDDLVSGYAGIPRNMTTIATLLARPVETPLATEHLLENTDKVLRPHHCSLGTAACYLLVMLTRAILMPSSFQRPSLSSSWSKSTAPTAARRAPRR